MRTPVTFRPLVADEADSRATRRLTDEQWLKMMATVDNREGWQWSLPEREGEPVRLLPPGESLTWRFDADGTVYREPFEVAEPV